MDVPEILVGNRSEVRKRVKNALRARKQTLPIDLLGRLEGAGMVPVQAGQRIRFESPVFERSTKSETSEVWLSEFIEALVAAKLPLPHDERLAWLSSRPWGCVVLLGAGNPRAWSHYWDNMRAHLPAIYQSGAKFVNGYGQVANQVHQVSWDLEKMLLWGRRAVLKTFEEPFTPDTFLPEFASVGPLPTAEEG